MKNILSKLKDILTKKDKIYLSILFLFSIFISIIETLGISVIMPFLSVVMNFDTIQNNRYYSYIYDTYGFMSNIHFAMAFGGVLILFYIARSAINIFYTYHLAKFSQGRYHLLAYRLFENYMGMPYKNFVTKNSSTLTKSIISEASGFTNLLSSCVFMMSEVLIVIFIYMMMLWVDYQVTLAMTIVLWINAVIMLKTVSVRMKKEGFRRAELQRLFYEIINKSFGNFKILKLKSNDKMVLEEFEKSSHGHAQANIKSQTLLQVPRLLLEAIGFSIIISIIMYMIWKNQGNIGEALSMLSMFVLSLYRMLPSVNRITTSYNIIMFNYKALEIIHNDLMYDSENLGEEEIHFNHKIELQNICFEYEKSRIVLDSISLTIIKGEKIAFVGESGGGKSTLVDLIIGLYRPMNGKIKIDNVDLEYSNVKSWRRKIGYIPQSVYLFDGTVGQNIAFSGDYDKVKVDECLKKAKIYDFLQTKEGADTPVGEGGIMLSGGQKQRIAIARALYDDPEILVLDEATSALDDATEIQIMDEIYDVSSNKTLIIIAHRLSTIQRCEKIYTLVNGRLTLNSK